MIAEYDAPTLMQMRLELASLLNQVGKLPADDTAAFAREALIRISQIYAISVARGAEPLRPEDKARLGNIVSFHLDAQPQRIVAE